MVYNTYIKKNNLHCSKISTTLISQSPPMNLICTSQGTLPAFAESLGPSTGCSLSNEWTNTNVALCCVAGQLDTIQYKGIIWNVNHSQ